MNLLDYLLAVILVYCLIRGIFRGLIKELSSIVGVLSGLYAAYTYYPRLARLLQRWISNVGYLNIVSCLVLFIGVYIIVSVIGVMIKYFMSVAFLGWIDRVGGALLGAIKGGLIAAVLILIFTTFLPKNAPVLRGSMGARHMMRVSATLVQLASSDMKHLFISKKRELNKTWQTRRM
jgi:membrane protein required for colicin V production